MSCCTDTWTGTKTSHCAGCCETFTGLTAFDAHQRAGACLDPPEIGLVDSGRRTRHQSTIWGQPGPDTPRTWPIATPSPEENQ